MKIDVEGAEMSVLRGAEQLLTADHDLTLLVDIHPQVGVNPREVCQHLERRGFDVFEEQSPFNTAISRYDNLTSIVARRVT